MNNNLKPIKETEIKQNNLKTINKETETKNIKNEKNITNLPTWNIEPPIEINRSQK